MSSKEFNQDVLCVNVIDRSGSMYNLTQGTVDGFNEFVKQQACLEGDAYFSLVLFDDKIEVPVDVFTNEKIVGLKANKMPEMTAPVDSHGYPIKVWNMTKRETDQTLKGHRLPYYGRGSTALRDAVGVAIEGTDSWLKNNEWFKGHVVLTVTTDGLENHSTVWSASALRAKVAEKEAQGWTIVFQGSNNSWLQAEDFGLNRNHVQTFSNTYAGSFNSYLSNSNAIGSLRSAGIYDASVTNTAYSPSNSDDTVK